MALAAFALVPCNLLLLDEASNHLDAATINALTAALQVTLPPLSCLLCPMIKVSLDFYSSQPSHAFTLLVPNTVS